MVSLIGIALLQLLIFVGHTSCQDSFAYFPMSTVKFKLPFNEKSQSIFSKIPIGRFEILSIGRKKESSTEYVYTLEQNNLLRVNNSTGEVFMKNDYKVQMKNTQIILTASQCNTHEMPNKIPQMLLEITPQDEDTYCSHLENLCFWNEVQYTIVKSVDTFEQLHVGSLNPRATRYLCPITDVKYTLKSGEKYFSLKNNEIYTKVPLDYEYFNMTELANYALSVNCTIRVNKDKVFKFGKIIKIVLQDRNDNGPDVRHHSEYNFILDNSQFKQNEPVGNKIIFSDKDSLAANTNLTYKVSKDFSDLVRLDCTANETNQTAPRKSIFGCQILFSRNDILSQSPYCFTLHATDNTIESNITKTAKVNVCLHTNTSRLNERQQSSVFHEYPELNNTTESLLNGDNRGFPIPIISNTYPKDVFVPRSALLYSRVAQLENFQKLLEFRDAKFKIAEDRSGAFGITPIAGIIYVRNKVLLQEAPETVYFLNITWHDVYQRSFVINVHLVNESSHNTTCKQNMKSRSQACAQMKYQKQCMKFCGLGTKGEPCQWRGFNTNFLARNYASCVPDAKHCPDNICDPLEDLNKYLCPQDCIGNDKIVGTHTTNSNGRGIYLATGTCICEDSGKCLCAKLNDTERHPKSKHKNETKFIDVNMLGMFSDLEGISFRKKINITNKVIKDDDMSIFVTGFTCEQSCIFLVITCPLVLIVLIICFFVTQKNLISSKQVFIQKRMGNGDDVRARKFESDEIQFDKTGTKWEFDRSNLKLDAVIGVGEFGKVVKGCATNIADICGVTTVAVKMPKNNYNSVECMALLSEFQMLQEVSHPNVIRLLGACTKSETPMIILEFAKYGSLLSYLRLSRKIECSGVDYTDGVEPITVKDILSFAWQICKGMAYLTEIKLVHRDLAARNVLLADGKICKISDFGLTRDVCENEAYLKHSRDRVPLKWMAPESLSDHVYTNKSDVWAFGVLCWELITLGELPYPEILPHNLYHLLKTGYRMERPENCSDKIYSILRSCWLDEPSSRPSFNFLVAQFKKWLDENEKCIEVKSNTNLNSVSNLEILLWKPPKICYDIQYECLNSEQLPTIFRMECHQPPPGYDVPRPISKTVRTKRSIYFGDDLRFPLNIRKSVCDSITTSRGQNGAAGNGSDGAMESGHSYIDITNETFIPDNLDSFEFEKHISKTISFQFSSTLNLKEPDNQGTI